ERNIEDLWWVCAVNHIAEDTIGFCREPAGTQDKKMQRKRDTHKLVQEKNRLRKNRDQAIGIDREILQRRYRDIKGKIRAVERERKLSGRVAASSLQKEMGKDPRKYWKLLKKMT